MIGTALRERTSRQMSRPLGPGIMMSRISRSKGIPSPSSSARLVAVGGRGHLEALLGQRVADRVADRGLVVGDQDAAAAHRALSWYIVRPPGSGSVGRRGGGPRRCCPRPRRSRRRSRPPITSTMRRAIARPRPKPSCLRDSRAPVEALEDALDLRRGNAGAGVDHFQDDLALPVVAAANGNGPGGRRVLEGVGQQADHHLAQQGRVAGGGAGPARPRRRARSRRGASTAATTSRTAAGTSTTSLSAAPRDSTRARVSSDWVRRLIRSASSARRSRKWSRSPGARSWRRPAAPRSRRRSRPAGCAARGRRWRRSRLRRTRAAARRCGRAATASTARSSGSERAVIA